MVTSLSKLIDMIQDGAIPTWLRDEVVVKRDEIEKAMIEKGSYTFASPDGEQIEIRADKAAAA